MGYRQGMTETNFRHETGHDSTTVTLFCGGRKVFTEQETWSSLFSRGVWLNLLIPAYQGGRMRVLVLHVGLLISKL
jgi:hypothetical protein